MGYHADTCAAIIHHICEKRKLTELAIEQERDQVLCSRIYTCIMTGVKTKNNSLKSVASKVLLIFNLPFVVSCSLFHKWSWLVLIKISPKGISNYVQFIDNTLLILGFFL